MTRLKDLNTATLSPYLVQHIDNPVNWHVWGQDAFAEAVERDVPVMLSVGYSACHWCHVMAHESFEDDATAEYMNTHFVNIKVDREERPDVDRIYMDAVQAMTGQGGWPMTVFMTPVGEPFFAGTYFPVEARGHHPSFTSVMEAITDAWATRRDELHDQASRLTSAATRSIPPAEEPPGVSLVDAGIRALLGAFDHVNGGFGGAPKFPQAPNLELIIRRLALEPDGVATQPLEEALTTTLDRMADGGIYDHVGGGFARYAVDAVWLVPHFEKMLYDNALLARIYLRAWQLTGNHRYQEVAVQTLDYLARDLLDPAGGLHAAEDADSEGVEGKFYVWSRDEFDAVVGPESSIVSDFYGVTEAGNFEGTNILYRPDTSNTVADRHGVSVGELRELVAAANTKLMTVRDARVRPGRDDKIITSWNGLAMAAFAHAGVVLGRDDYLEIATGVASFVEAHLTRPDGTIMRSWRGGATSVAGFCEDYGAAALGFLTLYQATGDVHWFTAGDRAARQMVQRFAAPDGGFYATEQGAGLLTRPMNLMDNPIPSDNALATEALLVLSGLTGDSEVEAAAVATFQAGGVLIERYPSAVGHLLAVLATTLHGVRQVAIVGHGAATREMVREFWAVYRPECVIAVGHHNPRDADAGTVPLLTGRTAGPNGARAYVCRDFVCDLPVSDPAALRAKLTGIQP